MFRRQVLSDMLAHHWNIRPRGYGIAVKAHPNPSLHPTIGVNACSDESNGPCTVSKNLGASMTMSPQNMLWICFGIAQWCSAGESLVYHLPIPVKCIVQKQESNNESTQGSTVDCTNTSEKTAVSSATDDKPLEGRFSYSYPLLLQKNYTANFAKEDKCGLKIAFSTWPTAIECYIALVVFQISVHDVSVFSIWTS